MFSEKAQNRKPKFKFKKAGGRGRFRPTFIGWVWAPAVSFVGLFGLRAIPVLAGLLKRERFIMLICKACACVRFQLV